MGFGRKLKYVTAALFLSLAVGTGLFLYNANHSYNVKSGFVSLPLSFNPSDSSSYYNWNGTEITIRGGFVKGIQGEGKQGDSLVIRALSPLPSIEIKQKDTAEREISITLENINPDFYAQSVQDVDGMQRIAVNALQFAVRLNAGQTKSINPAQPTELANHAYVNLGDNRDGYETFGQIIDQVDALNPAFVIDNGDLVYSGKPNQYRLFDQFAGRISTTLCTTLGNHDVRDGGRNTYTKLYGPAYYSFDFASCHFAFLDSSLGWSQKQAIPEEQYAWLESDLEKSQGKRLFVISHIPPEDPRNRKEPNKIPAYVDKVEQGYSFFEQKLNQYDQNKDYEHGFADKDEARRFEGLMEKYHVEAVYLSHIHSYFDYTKNGVRYIISGGAGAELLTKNSYYHYLILKTDEKNSVTMVQLPSPVNRLVKRYAATVSLFAEALYLENPAAVILWLIALTLFVVLNLLLLYKKFNVRFALSWLLLKDTGKFASKKYRELFGRKNRK